MLHPGVAILWMLPMLGSVMQAPVVEEDAEALLTRMRPVWTEPELSLEDLALDPDRKQRHDVTALEAAEDVERLFELFAHGYSGYGFFDQGGRFEAARRKILTELTTRAVWKVADLPPLFRKHLDFVRDYHTKIGGVSFGEHHDLWLDRDLEFYEDRGAWRFRVDGVNQTLVAIDGGAPQEFLFASLNAEGKPVHRLGVLSATPPPPLILEANSDAGTWRREITLDRSDFTYWADEVFREDRIGGVGVLRVRSFGDADPESLRRFVESADRYRDAPCVVIDLRGNGGGNERWASDWIEHLTGHRPGSAFIFSELESRTTMAGRLNAHLWWDHLAPNIEAFGRGIDRYRAALARFAPGGEAPHWTGPFFPNNPRIPNETTVVVVTNGLVASAGEGFVTRMRQAENVFVVGENTRGALTFGNVSLHRLPRSGLEVWLPININVLDDLSFREEQGLFPDWWVAAGDAVNFAVAALRCGTIPTGRPLGEEVLASSFVPEDPLHRERRLVRRRLGAAVAGAVVGLVVAFRMRRRPLLHVPIGLGWLAIGTIWLLLGRSRGPLLTDGGQAFVSLGTMLLCSGVIGAVCRYTTDGARKTPRPQAGALSK